MSSDRFSRRDSLENLIRMSATLIREMQEQKQLSQNAIEKMRLDRDMQDQLSMAKPLLDEYIIIWERRKFSIPEDIEDFIYTFPELKDRIKEEAPAPVQTPAAQEQSNKSLESLQGSGETGVSNAFIEAGDYEYFVSSIRPSICRVEAPEQGDVLGSGSLIAPRLVLTNYHVLKAIKGPPNFAAKASRLQFRFGYTKRGTMISSGNLFRADPQDPLKSMSSDDKLDYALIYLAEDPVDGNGNRITPLSTAFARDLVLKDRVAVVQYPEGEPLKVAWGEVKYVDPNGRRFQYTSNTLKGSSGSPVFDRHWNLIGLHHSGTPSESEIKFGNQGIPLKAILAEIQTYL